MCARAFVAAKCDQGISANSRPLDKSGIEQFILLLLNQNMCCGCSKEPFQ